MNEPIFNLNQLYTIAIMQQWLPPGVTNCIVFNFNYTVIPDNMISESVVALNAVHFPMTHNESIAID